MSTLVFKPKVDGKLLSEQYAIEVMKEEESQPTFVVVYRGKDRDGNYSRWEAVKSGGSSGGLLDNRVKFDTWGKAVGYIKRQVKIDEKAAEKLAALLAEQ